MATAQERAKPFAADRPGFSVALDHDVGKCGANRGVEQVLRSCDVDEHVSVARLSCDPGDMDAPRNGWTTVLFPELPLVSDRA